MNNLLKCQWYQLKHNSLFWLTIAIPLIFALIIIQPAYLKDAPMVPDIPHNLQGLFMAATADCIFPLLIIAGAFTAMLFGQQFSGRTIDCEISAGHNRSTIFISRCIVSFILLNAAVLIAILIGCIRCAFWISWPSVSEVVPYFIRTILLLSLLDFSLFSACIFFAVLFKDAAKTMAVSALFLLIACWFMAGLLQYTSKVPGTLYTNTPGLALLIHPAYLMREVLQIKLNLQSCIEAVAVSIGWMALFLGSGYCVFRRSELK